MVNSLSGFHMGMLRQICFHFVAYDFVQLTWKDSMWIKTDAFQGTLPGSLTIFFLPYQTVFLYPGKTEDLSHKENAKSLSRATAVCTRTDLWARSGCWFWIQAHSLRDADPLPWLPCE